MRFLWQKCAAIGLDCAHQLLIVVDGLLSCVCVRCYVLFISLSQARIMRCKCVLPQGPMRGHYLISTLIFSNEFLFFFFLNSSATLLPIYISLPLLYPPLLPSISVSSRALLITRLRHGREAVFLFRDDEVWAMTCWTLCEPTVKCCHHTASPRTQSLCRGQQQSDPTAR